jgi:tail tube protein
MGYSSQAGQVGFGIQSVKGTPVAATRFARLRSGSMGGNRPLLIPDPEIGGHRDVQNAYMGPISFEGSFDFYPRAQMVAMLLYAAMGAKQSTAGTPAAEVQTLTITGAPTGGTYKLRYRGQTTTPLAYNAAFGVIDTALEALSTIGVGNVAVTGAGPYVITFGGALAGQNVYPLTVEDVALTGGTAPAAALSTTTPGTSGNNTHILTPADDIPWLSVEERIGNQFESFRYTDAKVNTFHLEADAQGFLMGSSDIVAIRQEAGFTEQTTPAWDESPLYVGGTILVRFNGVTLNAKSFNFDFANNMETDDFQLGSPFLNDLVPKRREVKLGFTHRPNDALLWRRAMYGDSSYTEAHAGAAYRGNMEVEIVSYETLDGTLNGTPFSIGLEFPNVVIAPFSVSPSGDDVIQADLEVQAIRPDRLVPIMTATIVDDLATVI